MICHCMNFRIHQQYWQYGDIRLLPNANPLHVLPLDCHATLSMHTFGPLFDSYIVPLYRWYQDQELYLKFHMCLWLETILVVALDLSMHLIALWPFSVFPSMLIISKWKMLMMTTTTVDDDVCSFKILNLSLTQITAQSEIAKIIINYIFM